MSFDTSGKLRAMRRSDGWYVVGGGMLCPVKDREEAEKFIEKMTNKSDNKGAE
tara:strand:+ start:380 stop:538 length:159 start_codon:yes stop_codon:yes gene_type:complete